LDTDYLPQWDTKANPFQGILKYRLVYDEYRSLIFKVFGNRTFCTTRMGYIGLKLLGAFGGDKIVLLSEGRTSYLIRKESKGI